MFWVGGVVCSQITALALDTWHNFSGLASQANPKPYCGRPTVALSHTDPGLDGEPVREGLR